MRLYRGLKEPYRSDRRPDPLEGVNFTDCPYTAMLYAAGTRGQVLVLDVSDEVAGVRVRKQLWLNDKVERLMVWGRFDDYIVGILQANSSQGYGGDAGQLQVRCSEMGHRRSLTPSLSSPNPYLGWGPGKTGIVPGRS